MKKLMFIGVLMAIPLYGEISDHTITIRMNNDIETIDLSQQNPETRRILHKLAYKQYLQHNQWATFKAALAACAIATTVTTGAALTAVYYANK